MAIRQLALLTLLPLAACATTAKVGYNEAGIPAVQAAEEGEWARLHCGALPPLLDIPVAGAQAAWPAPSRRATPAIPCPIL